MAFTIKVNGTAHDVDADRDVGTDGQIVLTMPYVEMGQGTYTSRC